MTKKVLINTLLCLAAAIPAFAQSPPVPVQSVVYSNIVSTSTLDGCYSGYPCIDNRSQSTRRSSYHAFRVFGTGTWSVTMKWADTTPTGFVSYGSTAVVTNASPSSAIGYGLDPASITKNWHDYIIFEITGSATIQNYFGTKSAWWSPSVAGISYPLTSAQGGTGVIYPAFYYDRLETTAKAGCAAAKAAGLTWLGTTLWVGEVAGTYDCDKWFVAGGKIRFAASAAVTIKGSITASLSQWIFDVTTNASVNMTAGDSAAIQAPISWAWFTTPNGSTDNTTGIQAAFHFIGADGTGSSSPKVAKLSCIGSYVISATITINNFAGEVDCGGPGDTAATPQGSQWKWKTGASAGIPMFKYDNSRGMYWHGFQSFGNSANPPSAHFNCSAGAFGGGAANQLNRFSDFYIENSSSPAVSATNGFLTDGLNANCDSHLLENGYISHVTNAINLTRTQNADWTAINLICVNNAVCSKTAASNFQCINCSLGGMTTAEWSPQLDSAGGASNASILLQNTVSDGSARWVSDGGVATGGFVFRSTGGSYNINDAGGSPNDGACGPASNLTLYPACTYFVKLNSVLSLAVDIDQTQIGAVGLTPKPMFSFGSAVAGYSRHVNIKNISLSCSSWNYTNFLFMTAVQTYSQQDLTFLDACDGGFRMSGGTFGLNTVSQPLPGMFQWSGTVATQSTIQTCDGLSTCTIDLSQGNLKTIYLTGNVATSAIANGYSGLYSICLLQDGTGGRTFAWPSTVAGADAITTTANIVNCQSFAYTRTLSGFNVPMRAIAPKQVSNP